MARDVDLESGKRFEGRWKIEKITNPWDKKVGGGLTQGERRVR